MADLTIAEVKAAMHDVIDEQRKNFWVEPQEHFLDHQLLKDCRAGRDEWRDNHKFISEIRAAGFQARKVGIGVLVTALLGGIWLIIKKAFGI